MYDALYPWCQRQVGDPAGPTSGAAKQSGGCFKPKADLLRRGPALPYKSRSRWRWNQYLRTRIRFK
jgi:hypothetical protein